MWLATITVQSSSLLVDAPPWISFATEIFDVVSNLFGDITADLSAIIAAASARRSATSMNERFPACSSRCGPR